MAYDRFAAVDEDFLFPPEVREANASSPEFRNQVVPMTQTQRNNLTGDDLWDGRLIMNTTTRRIDMYDLASSEWLQMTTEPAGIIKEYAGPTAPDFHVLADGSVYPRTGVYAALFAEIGTIYNTGGELSTEFRVPNRKGRVGVGVDPGQPEFNSLGETGGAKTKSLGNAEMPGHNHGGATGGQSVDHSHDSSADGGHQHQTYLGDEPYSKSGGFLTKSYNATPGDATTGAGAHDHSISGASTDHSHSIPTEGSAQAFSLLQPYIALNYIITL